MRSIPMAPRELDPPTYAESWLGQRDKVIGDHGFGDEVIGSAWWQQRLRTMGLRQTFPAYGGEHVTRADLFELGESAAEVEWEQDALLTFVWHVLAWGTGASQRGNAARLRAFAETGQLREERVRLLRDAFALARQGEATHAYRALIRRGGGRIPGFGPAFFTKLLYFASEGCQTEGDGMRSLILDARVAGNLARAGWSSLPQGRSGYSYNWYTDTYRSYCELLARWAGEASEAQGVLILPDEFERALFAGVERPRS